MRRRLLVAGLAAVVALLATSTVATAGATGGPTSRTQSKAPPTFPSTRWLTLVNYYRAGSGLSPVTANATWVAGLKDHLRYLAKTPAKYMVGAYASLHTENPASPYYTAAGAKEAASSDLYEGYVGATPVELIDGWLRAPFHAIGMLRPDLKQVAFASTPTTGDAGIDVISGLTEIASFEKPPKQVLFPGPGEVTNLDSYGGELPNALKTCHWTKVSAGLPLVALLTSAPARSISATLRGPHGTESSTKGTICIVDENHYTSPTTIYGPTGSEILSGTRAVLLYPHTPLSDGRFVATIVQAGKAPISWSFTVRT